jgi:hypothetical protein
MDPEFNLRGNEFREKGRKEIDVALIISILLLDAQA